MQILVVQTAFVGDLFLGIPLFKQIPHYFKNAEITLVCRKGLGDFFLKTGLVSKVKEVEKNNSDSYRSVLRELKNKNFEYILCPHQSFRSARLVASVPAQLEKVGFKKAWNFWAFSKTVSYPAHLPDALRQLSLLAEINPEFSSIYHAELGKDLYSPLVRDIDLDFRSIEIPEWASMRLPETLELKGRALAEGTCFVVPGSVWATKKWTLSGYKKVSETLASQGHPVVLLGTKDEHPLCEEVRVAVPSVINLAGQTSIYESVALMQRGRVLVCNDSGAMHLGAAAGLPTVAVFGPTTLDMGFRPWNQNSIVLQNDPACRPCGRHGHKKCPIGTHECMTAITADRVLAAVSKLVG